MSVSCEITDDSRPRTATRSLMRWLRIDQAGTAGGLDTGLHGGLSVVGR